MNEAMPCKTSLVSLIWAQWTHVLTSQTYVHSLLLQSPIFQFNAHTFVQIFRWKRLVCSAPVAPTSAAGQKPRGDSKTVCLINWKTLSFNSYYSRMKGRPCDVSADIINTQGTSLLSLRKRSCAEWDKPTTGLKSLYAFGQIKYVFRGVNMWEMKTFFYIVNPQIHPVIDTKLLLSF